MSELSSSAVVPAGYPFDAWRLRMLSPSEFRALGGEGQLSFEQLRYLSEWALLAPTSHNTVPQRFRLRPGDGLIDVAVDRRSILPASDPTGRQCLVSLGCALANLEIAAGVFGFDLQLRFEQVGPESLKPFAETESPSQRYCHLLTLEVRRAGAALGTEWLSLLREHKVLRAEYDRTTQLPHALEQHIRRVMADECRRMGTAELHLITEPAVLRALGRFQEQADRFFFESTPFVRELGQWLLPNNETEACVGMRGREFGFDDAFARHVHCALRGERPLLPDQVAGFAKGGKFGLESSTAVAIFSVESESPRDLILAGRAAHKVSLAALEDGFQTAYHAALTEAEWVRQMMAATVLQTDRIPVVMLRLGKPKRPEDLGRPHASRPAVDDILLS